MPALQALSRSPTGAQLIGELGRRGASVIVVSDAEFARRFGADGVAASLDTSGRKPEIVVAEGFLSVPPDYLPTAIAHEAAHLVDDATFTRYSALHPGDALVWSETMAAVVQGVVARELGIVDPGPGGAAMRDDGTLRSPEETARRIRREPGYEGHADPDRRPALRWSLSSADVLLQRIARRAARPR